MLVESKEQDKLRARRGRGMKRQREATYADDPKVPDVEDNEFRSTGPPRPGSHQAAELTQLHPAGALTNVVHMHERRRVGAPAAGVDAAPAERGKRGRPHKERKGEGWMERKERGR